jgi:hypothetical protein
MEEELKKFEIENAEIKMTLREDYLLARKETE